MKFYVIYSILILSVVTCIEQHIKKYCMTKVSTKTATQIDYCYNFPNNCNMYNDCIGRASMNYGVDACLVKAIIQVESNYNPTVVSKSNAVGLMQLKANTAGRDAYKLKGWSGEPSIYELKNAGINIDLGTAYLSILQKQLEGIVDLKTRRYAIITSYVNGVGALLRMFSLDRDYAINEINKLNSEQFYQYIQYHHPSYQARKYLSKVNNIYIFLKR